MTTSNRRIALLTGASLAALGVSVLAASPALAAPHDTLGTGSYPGIGTADDTIVICDLAAPGNTTVPGSPCFFGQINRAGGPAIVAGTALGEIFQYVTALEVDASMANDAGSSAEVGAISVGGPAGFAHIFGTAIRQQGNAGDDGAITINNAGNLLVDAYATGTAAANAGVGRGIVQTLNAYDSATVNLNNAAGANLSIEAIAYASGTEGVFASAQFGTEGGAAIVQNSHGISANANIVNAGNIDIGAHAQAYGTAAQAIAFGNEAILQNIHASGSYATAAGAPGDATANLTNDGLINIHATASATASGNPYPTGFANAVGIMIVGVDQDVVADGGNANANIANTGTLNVNVIANASGDGGAAAFGLLGRGIDQAVTANAVGHRHDGEHTTRPRVRRRKCIADQWRHDQCRRYRKCDSLFHGQCHRGSHAPASTSRPTPTRQRSALRRASWTSAASHCLHDKAADGMINIGAVALANGGRPARGDASANSPASSTVSSRTPMPGPASSRDPAQ